MMHPNLRHLEIFLSLCATGSVTSTSRALNLTQPAVSKPQTINPAVSIVLILSEVLVVG